MNEHIAPVLVTGATGNVGREVVRCLRALDIPCVAAGTNPARIRSMLGEDVDTTVIDLTDPATYGAAVRGMRGLFLLRPPSVANVKSTLSVLLKTAIEAGVEHVAFLSVDGADRQKWLPHHAVEALLLSSGVSCTLLRPGFFAQNLGAAYLADIRDDDRLYVPAGHGKVAFVDVRDVAELAARGFAEAALRRQAWALTGPESVGFDEVAAALSSTLGRQIRYVPASIPGYMLHLKRTGLPLMQIGVQTALHVGLRLGNAATVDPNLSRLLGRRAHTIDQYIQDHQRLWSRESATTPANPRSAP